MYIPLWVIVAVAVWWAIYCLREQRDFNRMMRDNTPKTDAEAAAELAAHERKYKFLY
jgi:hypothetical protein